MKFDAEKSLKELERMTEYRHHSIPLDILDDLGSVSMIRDVRNRNTNLKIFSNDIFFVAEIHH